MADPVKKFSFGFTKTIKKNNFVSKPRNEAKLDKQLIDCLEGKLIKVKGGEKCVEEKPLIIPLQQSSRKVLVKSEIGEVSKDHKSSLGENVVIKQEKLDTEETVQSSQPTDTSTLPIKTEPPETVTSSLEEIAAREILQEAENLHKKDDYSNLTVLAAPEAEELSAEPTAEDYEAIPVSAFGIAMLKGMGWQEEAGIGKKPQKVATVEATGPKRLSSAVEQKLRAANMVPKSESIKEEEELKLTKGALVKILSGSTKGEYGEVEGFTDECDRLLVKLTIRGVTVSFSEAALQVVTRSEYTKNSRVLNSSKYEEVKNKVSQSLEDSSRLFSPRRSRRSVDISREGSRDRSLSPRRRRERSPDQRKRSPDRRKERSPSDRSSDKRYQQRSPSSSPDSKRRKPEGKHSRRESPRRRSASSLSPVRDPKKKSNEESSKRPRNNNEKSRHLREDTHSRRCSNSRSVSPQESQKRLEKSQNESNSYSEFQRKVKKSSKKKHKRRSSSDSDSDSSSPMKCSSHKKKKKKKKSHKKKKSKRRESSSSPERRKK